LLIFLISASGSSWHTASKSKVFSVFICYAPY